MEDYDPLSTVKETENKCIHVHTDACTHTHAHTRARAHTHYAHTLRDFTLSK